MNPAYGLTGVTALGCFPLANTLRINVLQNVEIAPGNGPGTDFNRFGKLSLLHFRVNRSPAYAKQLYDFFDSEKLKLIEVLGHGFAPP